MIEWADRIDEYYMQYFKDFIQVFLEKDNDVVRIIPHGRWVSLFVKRMEAA
jgi:hypothetical protein